MAEARNIIDERERILSINICILIILTHDSILSIQINDFEKAVWNMLITRENLILHESTRAYSA